MRILLAIAALALITTSAEAKVHEIKLGGRTTRIEVPANCKKISCVSVLGSEKSGSRSKKKTTEPKSVAAPAVAAPVAAAAVVAPQPAQPAPVAKVEPKVEPQADTQPMAADDRKPIARLTLPTPADEPKTVVANVTTAPAAMSRAVPAKADPANTDAASPVGLWLTQKREGKIRIEPCGEFLCGFADGKPSDKVLIDMKPGSNNRWNGKIKDVRSGSIYASHISLKGPNSLSVQGCAFGGMFCGGETWTRAE
jgi:uncharacterized protein (DUF2147 family)